MILFMIVAIRINLEISLTFFVVIPVMAVLLALIVLRVHPIFKRVFETYDGLNNVVQEDLKGIRVVKSFQQENHEIGKFQKISQSIYQDFAKGERIIALNSPLMQVCMYGCMILISWIGAKAIVASGNNAAYGLTTGNLTAMFTYATQILFSLMSLSMVFAMIVIASSPAQRIAEILQEETDISDPDQPVMTVKDGSIRFDHVDFSYASKADKQVLHDITLYAEPGQKVAFVGATGAGKTTITNLINRFYDIADGKIRYDGININKIKKADLRRSLGIVLQDVNLFTGTVMENLRYGNQNATDEECIAAAKLANADGFIRMLPQGYDTVLKGDGSGLSQGQRQLISIARAAVADPPVMILDEATSSIDTRTEALVQSGMDKLMEGRTVFVIAHRLSTVKNSDVIMVLDHGHIIEWGNHEKLIAEKGTYYQLYTGAFELE